MDIQAQQQILEESRKLLEKYQKEKQMCGETRELPYETDILIESLREQESGVPQQTLLPKALNGHSPGALAQNGQAPRESGEVWEQNRILCGYVRKLHEKMRLHSRELQKLTDVNAQLAREVRILQEDKLVLRAKLDDKDELLKKYYSLKEQLKAAQLKVAQEEPSNANLVKKIARENEQLSKLLRQKEEELEKEKQERDQEGSEQQRIVQEKLEQKLDIEQARNNRLVQEIAELRQKNDRLMDENAALQQEVCNVKLSHIG